MQCLHSALTEGGGVDKFMDMSGGGCDVLTIGGAPVLTGVRGRTWLELRWLRFFCELLIIA